MIVEAVLAFKLLSREVIAFFQRMKARDFELKKISTNCTYPCDSENIMFISDIT